MCTDKTGSEAAAILFFLSSISNKYVFDFVASFYFLYNILTLFIKFCFFECIWGGKLGLARALIL